MVFRFLELEKLNADSSMPGIKEDKLKIMSKKFY
jgi:hypothetical protein